MQTNIYKRINLHPNCIYLFKHGIAITHGHSSHAKYVIVEKSFSFLFKRSHMAFKRLADRFCRVGTVKQTRVKRRPIFNENNAAAILAFGALNRHASSRQMEKKSGISQRSVLRILHQYEFHPYRMSLHQNLYCNDFLKLVNFCNCIRRKMRTDVSFLSYILFYNEANFANTGNERLCRQSFDREHPPRSCVHSANRGAASSRRA